MELKDIKHLATLSRLEVSDVEAEELLGDLKAILVYVDQVTNVKVSGSEIDIPEHRNIAREDIAYNIGGEFTVVIMQNVPDKQDGYVKVNKILNE